MEKLSAQNTAGYPTPAGLTADPVVLTVREGELCVLLARRADQPYAGQLALPGGFIGLDKGFGESSDACAQRKLEEKTGMPAVYLERLNWYDRPGRDPRGWLVSLAYIALVPAEQLPAESDDVQWVPVAERPALPFDHDEMIEDAIERLRGKLWYSNIAIGLLPELFTLGEAQKVYEAIEGITHNAANFARSLRNSGLIEETDEISRGRPGRPAMLYRWVSREPSWRPRYGQTRRAPAR